MMNIYGALLVGELRKDFTDVHVPWAIIYLQPNTMSGESLLVFIFLLSVKKITF